MIGCSRMSPVTYFFCPTVHVWLHSEPDTVRSQTKLTDLPLIIADRRHSLLGHVCHLPPDVPAHKYPPALCQPLAWKMPCPRLEASTWSAKEDLDTTGGRGSRVHNRLAVVIGAGLLIVEVAMALAGQAQQWVSEATDGQDKYKATLAIFGTSVWW